MLITINTCAYVGRRLHKHIKGDMWLNEIYYNTCSESPHLRKAENDWRRAHIYWPPTVAKQYHNFWAKVSPGPSKPVLTKVRDANNDNIQSRNCSNINWVKEKHFGDQIKYIAYPLSLQTAKATIFSQRWQ